MPSPFPGMDPYLEQPELWSGVHARLIAILGEMLTRQVAPRYFVDSEDHVYIIPRDDPARPFVRPDIYVVEGTDGGPPERTRGRVAAPTLLIDLPPEEVTYPYLQVRDSANREVVATLELLSPANKVRGSAGRSDFEHKRGRLLRSTAHWIEIDLLRAGLRFLELPPSVAYYAALHRAGEAETIAAWTATLRQALPTIPVPLRAPTPDAALDLQEAVETLYTRYRYDAAIDYTQPPPPPDLSTTDAAWSEERVAAWRQALLPDG